MEERADSNYFINYIPRDIIYVFILAVVLNIARIVLFHSFYLAYILLNIFLAVLPFIASSLLSWIFHKNKLSKVIFVIGGIIWVILLPNAPYIVTDLIHIGKGHGAPILFDVLLLFSSAWLGLLIFIHSLSHMEYMLISKYGALITKIKIPIIILLSSIGIYIGRDLRFNSWDVINPSLFEDTWSRFTHPVHFTEACLFVIPCFLFLSVFYLAFKSTQK